MSAEQLLPPKGIADSLSCIAERKAAANVWEQLFLAILAGIYIGFGAVVATKVTSGGSLDPGLASFLGGSVFSVGLMLVLIPGSELFTGNILMTAGLLARTVHPTHIARNWVVVWIGNFAGSILLAWVMSRTDLLSGAVGDRAIGIANAKMDLPFDVCLFRGILCNMLVCLAVIMACSAKTAMGKILGIYFPIMAFVASGFEHSIANMYFLPAGLLADGQLGERFWDMFGNLIPVTLGNIIGGLAIIFLHPNNQKKLAKLFSRKEK